MELNSLPGVIVFTPEGRAWARQYLLGEAGFRLAKVNIDHDTCADLLTDEIVTGSTGVIATVDSVYKPGTAEEGAYKVQVFIKWEYVATIFFAKGFQKGTVGFKV
jgi:hypothetical protein